MSHYKIGGIETIDVIEAKLTTDEYIGFLKGNVIKYITRAGYKKNTDAFDDYNKAHDYLKRLLCLLDLLDADAPTTKKFTVNGTTFYANTFYAKKYTVSVNPQDIGR